MRTIPFCTDLGVHVWASQLTVPETSVEFERTDFEREWRRSGDAKSSIGAGRKVADA